LISLLFLATTSQIINANSNTTTPSKPVAAPHTISLFQPLIFHSPYQLIGPPHHTQNKKNKINTHKKPLLKLTKEKNTHFSSSKSITSLSPSFYFSSTTKSRTPPLIFFTMLPLTRHLIILKHQPRVTLSSSSAKHQPPHHPKKNGLSYFQTKLKLKPLSHKIKSLFFT
jgi:hypothetical protein